MRWATCGAAPVMILGDHVEDDTRAPPLTNVTNSRRALVVFAGGPAVSSLLVRLLLGRFTRERWCTGTISNPHAGVRLSV